jgi:hypothetical protein
MEASMLKDDRFLDDEANVGPSADQPVADAPKKRRARPKASTKPAPIESAAPSRADEAPPQRGQVNRGRGRPKGLRNTETIALEAAREQLDKANIGSRKHGRPMKEPKEILLESANYFWNRAQFLSDHARKLANEDATAANIDAIMDEAGKQLVLACKCATDAAPYFHARIMGPIPDGDAVVAYVARLPSPATSSEEWAAASSPDRWKQNTSH